MHLTTPKTNSISELKPYTQKELASFYGVCPKTLDKWLTPFQKKIGQRLGRFYTVKQVSIILDKLGMPRTISD
jgi:transposase-like protein